MEHLDDVVRDAIEERVPQRIRVRGGFELVEQRGVVRAESGRDSIIHEAGKQRGQLAAAKADQAT